MGKRLSVEVMTKPCGCGEEVGGRGWKSAVTDYVTIPCLKILRLKWRSKPAKLVKSMSGVEKRVKREASWLRCNGELTGYLERYVIAF